MIQVDSDSRPSAIGPPFTGHFRVIADTPRALQQFQPGPDVKKEPGRKYDPTDNSVTRAYKSASEQEKLDFNLEIRRNIYDHKGRDVMADLKDKPQTNGGDATTNGTSGDDTSNRTLDAIAKEPRKPIYCNSCAIDVTKGRFHYAKPVPELKNQTITVDVCSACFFDARISSKTEQHEYIWLEEKGSNIPEQDEPWTDAELLLLLEALERFDDSWNQIADYVGTRTREECVVKFLQLEIEDKYLDTDVGGPSYGALDEGRVPFAQSDNPVLSVLGYLASLSEPKIAAAAAGRSIEEMSKIRRRRLENGQGGAAAAEAEGTKAEDSMEVDAAGISPQAHDDNQVAAAAAAAADGPTSRDMMRDVANTTFATVAARSAALASNEEREMTRLVSAAVNMSLEKMELKLQQFSEMEAALEAERRELEKGRQQLFLDRLAFRKRVSETQEALKTASLRGGEEGARMAGEVGVGTGEGEKLMLVREGAATNDAVEGPSTGSVNYEI